MTATLRTRRPEPPLTTAQLELGFRHLWREGWSTSLQQTLAHPVRGPVVRCMARELVRTGLADRALAGRRLHSTPTTPRAAWHFDAKRAAANDLD